MTIQALGFLGLLGIGVLILIYLLKPNHQQRVISSIYVWQLSLKYRKKRIDVNKFRNILILICQILILTLCAVFLIKPLIVVDKTPDRIERVIIIDGSVNMRAQVEGVTRFEKALTEASELAKETINGGGIVTIITAGAEAEYITLETETLEQYTNDINERLSLDRCSFQVGDIEGAVEKAQLIVDKNQYAEVLFYSATEYAVIRNLEAENFINMSVDSAWNAAVLDIRAELFDNYYNFYIDVACYRRNLPDLAVTVRFTEVSRSGDAEKLEFVEYVRSVDCTDNQIATVVLEGLGDDGIGIYEFKDIVVTIDPNDSFSYDNSLILYGGVSETIRVQYSSSSPNPFFGGAVQALHSGFIDRYNVVASQIRSDGSDPEQYEQMDGFDYYIFEHKMPKDLPTDGVIFLVDPDSMPESIGIELTGRRSGNFTMRSGESHPIMTGVVSELIEATRYSQVTVYDETFVPLMYCGDDPVLLLKETESVKILILTVDVHYSTLSMLLEFPLMFFNIFDYFMPATLESFLFDVGDDIQLNTRGSKLTLDLGNDKKEEFTEFPVKYFNPDRYGTYTVSQTLLSGDTKFSNFYVKIAQSQSDFAFVEEELIAPYTADKKEIDYYDLFLFFAIALVLILFAEWYLQTREQS